MIKEQTKWVLFGAAVLGAYVLIFLPELAKEASEVVLRVAGPAKERQPDTSSR